MSSGPDPLHPQLGPQHQPVRESGHGDRLDVVGGDEVAAAQKRTSAGELQDRERPARAGSDLDAAVGPRGGDEVDHVADHGLGDMDALERALHLDEPGRVEHRR